MRPARPGSKLLRHKVPGGLATTVAAGPSGLDTAGPTGPGFPTRAGPTGPAGGAGSADPRGAVRAARYAAVTLETLIAVSAFGGGVAMIADPAGAMGMDPWLLERLPVDSWRLPGVALIACNGLLPLAMARAELLGRRWPRRYGHAVAGAVLLAWPVTETLLFGYPLDGEPVWLRPAVATTGLALIGLGLLLRRDGHDSEDDAQEGRASTASP